MTATLTPVWVARDYALWREALDGVLPSSVEVIRGSDVIHREEIPSGKGLPRQVDITGVPLILPGGRRRFWPALSVWRQATFGGQS